MVTLAIIAFMESVLALILAIAARRTGQPFLLGAGIGVAIQAIGMGIACLVLVAVSS